MRASFTESGVLSEHLDADLLRRIGLHGVGDVVEDAADIDGRVPFRRGVAEERAKARLDRVASVLLYTAKYAESLLISVESRWYGTL